MEIDYGLELSQQQKLIMTTKLVQSLKILNMSTAELEAEIKKQAEENPIMEIDTKDNDSRIDWENYIKNMQKYTYRDKNEFAYNVDNEVDFENMVRSTQNLYDYLKNQLRYYRIDKKQRKICEYIIDSLDENGYLDIQDEKLIMERLKIDKNTYYTCKSYVQSLEPNGVGGTTLEECLSIQLKNLNIKDDLLDQIIKEDLNNIANKKIKSICKKYNISQEQCINYIKIIKHLEPKPGKIYNTNEVQYIKPDVIIKKVDGNFIVVSNDKNDISININSFYQSMLNKQDSDEDTKKFIK